MSQFAACPRSVIQASQPVNRIRSKAESGSPAYVGQMLHDCLEVFANYRINLKQSFSDAYQAGLDRAKERGVLAQYMLMDKSVMDYLTANAESVMTQIPLIYNLTSDTVRRDSYNSAKTGDVLVGTADLIVVNKDGSFTVADWKTGLDDVDDAVDNHQLAALAWMASRFFGFKEYYLAVLNPVTKEADLVGPFDELTFDLDSFTSVDPEKEVAGDHCRYCPLKKNCTSFSEMSRKELINAGFQDNHVVGGQRSGSDDQASGSN